MPASRLPYLFERYMNGTSTEKEDIELATYILAPEHAVVLEQLEKEYWNKSNGEALREEETEIFLFKILQRKPQTAKLFYLRRIAVAASIVLALGIAGYFLLNNKATKKDEIAKTTRAPKDMKAPETNRAMITLVDGRKVYLDSVGNGQLAVQGDVKLLKNDDGQIVYQSIVNSQQSAAAYNTLTNPRGSKVIDMTLADGSRVWLNAGSSVTYPIAFVGKERKVSITGEAYFEVAHDAMKPFYVNKGDMQVQVLGTKFNVNAYDDEAEIKVSLLEGSVLVSQLATRNSQLIKPGQQAVLTHNAQLTTHSSVNLDEVMAWKNGRFQFNKASLQEVMRQLARWYDVEIVYEGKISTQTFSGKMQRELNLFELLDGLAKSQVHFKIEEKKLIVLP